MAPLSLNVRRRQSDLLRAPLKPTSCPSGRVNLALRPSRRPTCHVADHVLTMSPIWPCFVEDDNPLEFGHALVHWPKTRDSIRGVVGHGMPCVCSTTSLGSDVGWGRRGYPVMAQGKPRHVIARRCPLQPHTTQQDHLRIKQLREELHAHNHLYYVLASPTIADSSKPDALVGGVGRIWRANISELDDPASFTQSVEGDLTDRFEKVAHRSPMLSLSNTHTAEEVQAWVFDASTEALPEEVAEFA